MAGIVDQIKDRVDIVDLISGYLKLQKSGINYKARCPFHNEKSGSFFVSPERQIWHCFGCGLGGDAFGFIKQIDGVEFPEALRILAARAGIELKKQSPEFQEYQNSKTRLYDICELAMRFFEKQLYGSAVGKNALAYLQERGLSEDSIGSFHLGYAPDSWNALYDFLKRNYESKDIFDAGLVIKKDAPSYAKASEGEGRYYDRFRSRIIFPIFDLNGQVVGFTGRVFGNLAKNEEVGKYVNSPQTPIYDKSRVLYGLHAAKLDIRRANRCLVVEGNMDVIMSRQAGANHVVASSGTALTDGHLKIIKRYTDNLDLCFDADIAGSVATDRGVDLALARGFNVGIISINEPGLKDPADYVKIHGAKWAEVSQNSRPFMEFYFDTARTAYDTTTALGKKLFSQKLLPFLASMVNKIEQAHWVGEMALALKTKEEILRQELVLVKPRVEPSETQSPIPSAVTSQAAASFDPYEETLVSLMIKSPKLADKITGEHEEFLSANLKSLIEKFKLSGGPLPIAQLASSSGPALAMSLEFINLQSQELWSGMKDYELESEFEKLLGQIKKRKVAALLADMEYEIKSAEKLQDKSQIARLLGEFSQLSKKLN